MNELKVAELRALSQRVHNWIPVGDGYNSAYADDMEAAAKAIHEFARLLDVDDETVALAKDAYDDTYCAEYKAYGATRDNHETALRAALTAALTPPADGALEADLDYCRRQMKAVENYVKPNWSNDMEWSDEIIIAIDQREPHPAAHVEGGARVRVNERCQRVMRERGKPYPRTCYVCGLQGKCVTADADLYVLAAPAAGEGRKES